MGPTAQDRRIVYVDMLKERVTAVAKVVDTVHHETLRHIMATCVARVDQTARIAGGARVIVEQPGDCTFVRGGRDAEKKGQQKKQEKREYEVFRHRDEGW